MAASLPALFAALDAQVGVDPTRVTLCFHLDTCRDESEALVLRWRISADVHCSRARAADANAGRARRAAMALAETTGAPLLLTTDADSAPAQDWAARAVRSLARADVVAGRITRRGGAADAAQTRTKRFYDRLYELRRALDPLAWESAPRHHQTGGANLAFRAEAYRALGGFDPVASGEDAAVVDRAERLGLKVRRDATVRVKTSSRRHGRAPDGFAAALRRLDRDGAGGTVAHPADEAWRWRNHALARAGWADLPGGAARLAAALALSEAEVLAVAADRPNAGAFAARVVPDPPSGVRFLPLVEAERALGTLERADRKAA